MILMRICSLKMNVIAMTKESIICRDTKIHASNRCTAEERRKKAMELVSKAGSAREFILRMSIAMKLDIEYKIFNN